MSKWIDLVDPDEAELRKQTPKRLHARALDRLLAPAQHEDEPRPTLEGHGDYVFGVFLVPVAVPEEARVYYQEIDLVLTRELVLTARKTPPGGEEPFDTAGVHDTCTRGGVDEPGMVAYHLVDEVAEHYLDLIDALNDKIDELDDHVEDWPAEQVRGRISQLRHALLHIRRTLAPTRDAIRGVVDGRIELDGKRAFPTRGRAPLRRRLRQAPACQRGPRLLTRPSRRCARLQPGQDRQRPERGGEATDRNRLDPARADLHRRVVRPELHPQHARAALALRLRVVVGLDHRDDDRPDRLLPQETLAVGARSLPWLSAVFHLPQLQAALDRPRPARRPEPAGGLMPALRVRLPVRTARGLLPGAWHGFRRL